MTFAAAFPSAVAKSHREHGRPALLFQSRSFAKFIVHARLVPTSPRRSLHVGSRGIKNKPFLLHFLAYFILAELMKRSDTRGRHAVGHSYCNGLMFSKLHHRAPDGGFIYGYVILCFFCACACVCVRPHECASDLSQTQNGLGPKYFSVLY